MILEVINDTCLLYYFLCPFSPLSTHQAQTSLLCPSSPSDQTPRACSFQKRLALERYSKGRQRKFHGDQKSQALAGWHIQVWDLWEESSLLHSCEMKVMESCAQAQLACCFLRFAALAGPPHRCQAGPPGPQSLVTAATLSMCHL